MAIIGRGGTDYIEVMNPDLLIRNASEQGVTTESKSERQDSPSMRSVIIGSEANNRIQDCAKL